MGCWKSTSERNVYVISVYIKKLELSQKATELYTLVN